MHLPAWKTQWHDYYYKTDYSPHSFAEKKQIVSRWLKQTSAARVWDIGGNKGAFSCNSRAYSIVCDNDPLAIEQAFLQKTNKYLPLLLDITNPTPAYGFINAERTSFLSRIKQANIDCSLVLAVLHHLCITNNLTFSMLAKLLAETSQHLIIEYVDRQDERVRRLLTSTRENYPHFAFYTQENFITQFSAFFNIMHKHKITDTRRTLYLMRAKSRQ